MICNAPSRVATGPTIAQPASPDDHLDQRGNHRLVFDGKHAPSRERATRLCGLVQARLDLPAGTRGSLISMGWMGEQEGHRRPRFDPPGALSRLQRDPEIDPQPVALEFDPRLSAEPMAHFALDQAQTEAG